jgi:glucose 1-dehydrogenase
VRALVTRPGLPGSTTVEAVPDARAGAGEVLLRVLEVGVCGTDREIDHGHFGTASAAGGSLVLGHEVLAVVEEDGHGYARGDLVTATVRRSCGSCLACAEGSPDSCLTGRYSERGITRLDGFARELVAESADELVAVPRALGRLGVLAEPASICARALRHARTIGGRQPWRLQRALVLGGGSIGVLTTLLLRLDGVEVWTASLEAKNPLVEALGATYVALTQQDPEAALSELGRFDLVVEAAGSAQLAVAGVGLVRRSGLVCLLGLDGRAQRVEIDGPTLSVDMVLENRVVFGSVNAHRQDWLAAVGALDRARREWRDVLEAFVSLRVPLDRFAEAFEHRAGKATLVISDQLS